MNIWTHIWLKPRETIREAVSRPQNRVVEYGLLAIGGVVNALSYLLDDKYAAVPEAWVAAFIGGALFGVIGAYIVSWAIAFVGKKRGTPTSTNIILRATAWSNIIAVWMLPFAIVSAFFFPNVNSSMTTTVIALVTALIYMVGMVWLCCAYVIALSEVQGLSIWKTMTNMVLGSLLIAVPIMVLVGLAIVAVPLFTSGH